MNPSGSAQARSSVDQRLLEDAKLALALLDFGESTNIEERRFCAILKAQEVVDTMNQALSAQTGDQRGFIERARDELRNRLDRALADKVPLM